MEKEKTTKTDANEGKRRTSRIQSVESLEKWREFFRKERHIEKDVIFFALAISMHIGVFFLLKNINPPLQTSNSMGESGTNVRIVDSGPKAAPAVPQVSVPSAKANVGRKSSQARTKPTSKTRGMGKIATSKQPSTLKVPEANAVQEPLPAESEMDDVKTDGNFGAATFNPKLNNLLPGASSRLRSEQQNQAASEQKEAVAGDIEDKPFSPEPLVNPTPKPRFKREEYKYAGYLDSVNRRFSEAWVNDVSSGTRLVEPDPSFTADIGEAIQYNIYINRDGSLRKIENISAINNPEKNYQMVDREMARVYDQIFPFNPIPDRIKDDPLVLRKVVVFRGSQFRMF